VDPRSESLLTGIVTRLRPDETRDDGWVAPWLTPGGAASFRPTPAGPREVAAEAREYRQRRGPLSSWKLPYPGPAWFHRRGLSAAPLCSHPVSRYSENDPLWL